MASVLIPGLHDSGLIPGWGHGAVLLGKTFLTLSVPLPIQAYK